MTNPTTSGTEETPPDLRTKRTESRDDWCLSDFTLPGGLTSFIDFYGSLVKFTDFRSGSQKGVRNSRKDRSHSVRNLLKPEKRFRDRNPQSYPNEETPPHDLPARNQTPLETPWFLLQTVRTSVCGRVGKEETTPDTRKYVCVQDYDLCRGLVTFVGLKSCFCCKTVST